MENYDMISAICQEAIATNPDRTQVPDIHARCPEILENGEKCGCDCHPNVIQLP